MLKNRQKAFITEYLKDFNGTQAAIRSGYSKKGAEVRASNLLRNGKIQAEIQKVQDAACEKALVTIEYIVNNLKEVVERCLQHKAVMVFDRGAKEYVQKEDGAGNGIWEFDSAGANKALELLGRYKNIFKEDSKDIGKVVIEVTDFGKK